MAIAGVSARPAAAGRPAAGRDAERRGAGPRPGLAGAARSRGRAVGRLLAVAKRVGQAALVVLLAWTLTFFLLSLIPANAIEVRLKSADPSISQASIDAAVASAGLDRPRLVQYLDRLGALLQGDLGLSYAQGKPVTEVIAPALGSTAALTLGALLVAVIAAFAFGLLATQSRFGWVRGAFRALPGLVASMPAFVLGIFFIQLFAVKLRLVPIIDDGSAAALIGPAAILGLWLSAPMTQVFIRALEGTSAEAHVAVARTRGLPRRTVLLSHVVRNSSIPLLTMIGVLVGELIAGGIVTEMVFTREGIGTVTQTAVLGLDTPVLLAVVLLVAAIYATVNMAIDVISSFIDPKAGTA